jgi:hypothetical protein
VGDSVILEWFKATFSLWRTALRIEDILIVMHRLILWIYQRYSLLVQGVQ